MNDRSQDEEFHPHTEDYGFGSPAWLTKSLVYYVPMAQVRLALAKVIDYVYYKSRQVVLDEEGEEFYPGLDAEDVLDVIAQYLVTGSYTETVYHADGDEGTRQVDWRNPLLSTWLASSGVGHDHTGLTDEQKEDEITKFKEFLDSMKTATKDVLDSDAKEEGTEG